MKRDTGTGRFVDGGGQDRGTGRFQAKTMFEKERDLLESIKLSKAQIPAHFHSMANAYNAGDLDKVNFYAGEIKSLTRFIMKTELKYEDLRAAHISELNSRVR